MTDCPECANPAACVYRFDCEGCNVRMVARMPARIADAWMTDALRPAVEAERERMRKQPEGTT